MPRAIRTRRAAFGSQALKRLSILTAKILTFTAFLLTASCFGQIGGESVFTSLNLPGSARIAAMGGKQMATKDGDLSLGFYTPSLLDENMDKKMAFSYVNYFSDINFGYAGYARNLDSLLTLSLSMQYMSYGSFDQRDETGLKTGEFSAGDYILQAGAGLALDSSFSVGANLKGIYAAIAGYNAFGLGVDLSGTYNNRPKQFTASVMLNNLGIQLKSFDQGNREPLPFAIHLGISKKLRHAPFRFSLHAENLQRWNLRYDNPNEPSAIDPSPGKEGSTAKAADEIMRHLIFGGEFLLTENLHFQLGYNYRRRQEMRINDKPGTAGLSWGFGFKISKFRFNYGRATYHLAGASNHFSVSTSLSEW